MDILIAVDPGLDTGVAVFEDGVLVLTATISTPVLQLELLDVLNTHANMVKGPIDVVAEQPPSPKAHQPEATNRVVDLLKHWCSLRSDFSLSWVLPAQWKGTPQARLQEGEAEHCATKHERDACGMGRYKLAMNARFEATA